MTNRPKRSNGLNPVGLDESVMTMVGVWESGYWNTQSACNYYHIYSFYSSGVPYIYRPSEPLKIPVFSGEKGILHR